MTEAVPDDVMKRAEETLAKCPVLSNHHNFKISVKAIARALMEERAAERERWAAQVASLTKDRDKLLEEIWFARRHAFASDRYKPGTCMGCGHPREHPIHAI